MSYAVISDVHGNREALQAVLQEIEGKGIKDILFLGDAVGYGPAPDECLETLVSACSVLIAGNHDWGAADKMGIGRFNPFARLALGWTKEVMKKANLTLLKGLPLTAELRDKGAFLVHGSPKEPEKWQYLLTPEDAEENFPFFAQPLCFVGHSHLPFIIERTSEGDMTVHRNEATVTDGSRYIINPGSVGQPRDGDPRASFAVVENNLITIRRVEYDIPKTQAEMRAAGLPEFLVERLERGW